MINSIDIIQRQSKLNPRSLQHILLLSLFLSFILILVLFLTKRNQKEIGQWLTSDTDDNE